MATPATDKMRKAVGKFVVKLNDYPGWKEWTQAKVGRTLFFDNEFADDAKPIGDFEFTGDIEKQHTLVMRFLHLHQTVSGLKDCEYYFRRYPGLPISKADHISNICEMYFGRFYEFKERLKNYFDALIAVCPDHEINAGPFIRQFEKTFRVELKERNLAHHHERFSDMAISRVNVLTMLQGHLDIKAHNFYYRELKKEWVQRVQKRGATLESYLEQVSEASLRLCAFLPAD